MSRVNMMNRNNSEKFIKVDFIGSNNLYKKLVLNKTENNINTHTAVTPTKEDIYYDEVIYYDGGDVYGYGDS